MLHYTAMQTCAEALGRLCDPQAEVSAHYLIDRDGTCHSLVDEAQRAWHAGAGSWRGVDDVNSRSIGVELVNVGSEPFPEPQMVALEGLLTGILARWEIPPQGVIGHSDMAPERKGDPGLRFDWRRLALQGLSVWPEAAPVGDFMADIRAFGYPDAPLESVLTVFRLRFRPWATGPLDESDCKLAAGLRRFAVDARRRQA